MRFRKVQFFDSAQEFDELIAAALRAALLARRLRSSSRRIRWLSRLLLWHGISYLEL